MIEHTFHIIEEKISNVNFVKVENTKTREHFKLIPEYGGRLIELFLRNDSGIHSILRKVEHINSKNMDDIFTNAKLSPFANRIKDGQYDFNNGHYSLPIIFPEENNACHGFLYAKRFNIVRKEISDDYAACTLSYEYNQEEIGYPFSYVIELTYKLTLNDGLICTTKIKNQSPTQIPISDGWHHYFDLGVIVNELKLKMEVLSEVQVDNRKIPTGELKPYNKFDEPEIIDDTYFDTCFLVKQKNGKSITQLISEKDKISLTIWQESGKNKFNYLNIYIPSDRKSIAIEPMTSNINAFNNHEGLIILEPNEEFAASIGFHL